MCHSCAADNRHRPHNCVDLLTTFKKRKENIRRELDVLKKTIKRNYHASLSQLNEKREKVQQNTERVTIALENQQHIWCREINSIVHDMKSDIERIDTNHRRALFKEEKDIEHKLSEISKRIDDLTQLVDSEDTNAVSMYGSKIKEFEKLPSILELNLPSFSPKEIKTEQLKCDFGSLSSDDSSSSDSLLLDDLRLITTLHTGTQKANKIACLGDEELWVLQENNVMELYNLYGELKVSIKTKSDSFPVCIAVTRDEEALVCTDRRKKSINIVRKSKKEKTVKLKAWFPLGVCCAYKNDLLVIMENDSMTEAKVVRYTAEDLKETSSIQRDDEKRPLFSSGGSNKYLQENINQDICVADRDAHAMVVVSKTGKFRFRYTETTNYKYYPTDIATDKKGLILTADYVNTCIHALDMDGNLLRIFEYKEQPCSICVDSKNNLCVAELNSHNKVKKMQYYNQIKKNHL